MAGTKEGARKTAFRNKLLYGEDYYKQIGKIGGRISKGGGFKNKALASYWGKINGKRPKMTIKCDYENLSGEPCYVSAKELYTFTNNDGEEYVYYRCEFHPVPDDEHIEEAMSLRVRPLVKRGGDHVQVS